MAELLTGLVPDYTTRIAPTSIAAANRLPDEE
jgi:hypothetical protein